MSTSTKHIPNMDFENKHVGSAEYKLLVNGTVVVNYLSREVSLYKQSISSDNQVLSVMCSE